MKSEMAKLMKEQLENYVGFLGVCERQVKLLQGDVGEAGLEELLKEREKLFALISAVDEKIKKAAQNPAEGRPDPEDVKRLEETLKKVVEMDGKCGELLNKRKFSLADQIKSMNRSFTAVKGYGKGDAGGSGKFISRKG